MASESDDVSESDCGDNSDDGSKIGSEGGIGPDDIYYYNLTMELHQNQMSTYLELTNRPKTAFQRF